MRGLSRLVEMLATQAVLSRYASEHQSLPPNITAFLQGWSPPVSYEWIMSGYRMGTGIGHLRGQDFVCILLLPQRILSYLFPYQSSYMCKRSGILS